MLFNSIDFAIFLPIVFLLYWFVFNKSLKVQNFLIVVASYTFYGWWDWRFLSLLIFSCLMDYTMGRLLMSTENPRKRKLLLWLSVGLNLTFLGFFKYYNFFVESFVDAFSFFGHKINLGTLNIILPLGISFYTFQSLSYVIDVYRRKLKPTNDLISFLAFVSFFPQLVAGPIERATNLLPQFYKKRHFDRAKAVDGLRQILWGLLKKIVIADNCASFTNIIFQSPESYPGSTLFLGLVFFTIQLYCDFSGYSDIAIGTARLFGFSLMRNFAYPYFSRDMSEVWRRWHISLSTWFRDYLYFPMGGVWGSTYKKVKNVFVLFIVSAFWHGAKWTFIFWGLVHAFAVLPSLLNRRKVKLTRIVAQHTNWPSLKEFRMMFVTMCFVTFSNVFFRSEDLHHAFRYIKRMFSLSFFRFPIFPGFKQGMITLLFAFIFFFIEWRGRHQQYAIEKIGVNYSPVVRYGLYYLIIFIIFFFAGAQQEFIYFQF